MTEYKRAARAALSFSKPVPNADLRVISLGAGVQSSVMALMAAKEEVGPMPDCAIFADTQWEPRQVYEHLDWLEAQLPFPVIRVTKGNIYEDSLKLTNAFGNHNLPLPVYTTSNVSGKRGIAGRHCTSIYKIDPIKKEIRKQLGIERGKKVSKSIAVEQWLGISTDEIQRLKMASEGWLNNRWPLIEKAMSRNDCLSWWDKNYPNRKLAKSSCVGCPYRTNAQWRDVKKNNLDEFNKAVILDEKLRTNSAIPQHHVFLHNSRKPLKDVNFNSAEDDGQIEFGFLEECEGMCGI
jgi:hypothetical protein